MAIIFFNAVVALLSQFFYFELRWGSEERRRKMPNKYPITLTTDHNLHPHFLHIFHQFFLGFFSFHTCCDFSQNLPKQWLTFPSSHIPDI